MDIDYLGFIGACHSDTHMLVHPEDLPDFAWLVLPICSSYWQNSAWRVHFLSDTQCTASIGFKSLPAWIVRPWNQHSSLAALSPHLHWCRYTLIFFILLWLGLFGLFVWCFGGLFELFVCSFFVGLFWGEALTFWPLSCFFSLTTLYKLNVLATLKRMPEILDAIGAVSFGEHTGQ